MIKLKTDRRTIRETTADFEYTDENGETQTEQIRVRYYSPTIKEQKEWFEHVDAVRKNSPDTIVWQSEELARRVESLPDLVDAKGNAYKITVEFLEALDAKNLEAIDAAIRADLRPKSLAATSPNGSKAKAA